MDVAHFTSSYGKKPVQNQQIVLMNHDAEHIILEWRSDDQTKKLWIHLENLAEMLSR
jgi:hypothetical protein